MDERGEEKDMAKHVIVGAGSVGRHTAQLLAEAGKEVVLTSRSGVKPDLPGVRQVAIDATDGVALTAECRGAVALYNCANPPHYGNWETVWPALWASLLASAEATGATLVTASSLYAFGPVDVAMTESCPTSRQRRTGRSGPGSGPRPSRPTKPGGSRPSRSGPPTMPAPGWPPGTAISAATCAGTEGQAGVGDRRSRPAALLDRRPRRGPRTGRGGRPARVLGPGLARPDQ